MVARPSWLHIRQSPCSLLPCRRLLDRIREVLYRRGMKMSEFWISCLVSCGTFLFGFLWESSGQGGSLNDILHRFRELSRSEEHTSELQSLTNLVCRLLLEKKKSA